MGPTNTVASWEKKIGRVCRRRESLICRSSPTSKLAAPNRERYSLYNELSLSVELSSIDDVGDHDHDDDDDDDDGAPTHPIGSFLSS